MCSFNKKIKAIQVMTLIFFAFVYAFISKIQLETAPSFYKFLAFQIFSSD